VPVSGARYRRTPQKLNGINQQLPTDPNANLGSHCNANIVVRSEIIAIQFLSVFHGNHTGHTLYLSAPVEAISSPYNLLVEMWGTAPQSKKPIT